MINRWKRKANKKPSSSSSVLLLKDHAKMFDHETLTNKKRNPDENNVEISSSKNKFDQIIWIRRMFLFMNLKLNLIIESNKFFYIYSYSQTDMNPNIYSN